MKYKVGSGTDKGKVRRNNEDTISSLESVENKWYLLIVCDGMGGHVGGAKAGSLAAETIGKVFKERMEEGDSSSRIDEGKDAILEILRDALTAANANVYKLSNEDPYFKGMGTTASIMALIDDFAYIAHVGDSRIYRVRGRVIERMTTDHTSAQRLVDAGLLKESQAAHHPHSHILYRSIGQKPEVEVETRGPEQFLSGDRYLLCSDGLYDMIDERDLAAYVMSVAPDEAVRKLIDLANLRGGKDNISVQIICRADEEQPAAKSDPNLFEVLNPTSRGGEKNVNGGSEEDAADGYEENKGEVRDEKDISPGVTNGKTKSPSKAVGALIVAGIMMGLMLIIALAVGSDTRDSEVGPVRESSTVLIEDVIKSEYESEELEENILTGSEARKERTAEDEGIAQQVKKDEAETVNRFEGVGLNMIRIPGGTFNMGSTDGRDNERPVTRVTLSTYYIDRLPVTVENYSRCVEAGACTAPRTGTHYNWEAKGNERHPVNGVTWTQAREYCHWRGGDLPTEAQWEYAARGSDGRKYPWGNQKPDHEDCQYACWYKLSGTCEAGSYPDGASPFEVLDMSGNVWEWVLDWYGEYPGDFVTNPKGPENGEYRVLRGGAWNPGSAKGLIAAYRKGNSPENKNNNNGFRCSKDH